MMPTALLRRIFGLFACLLLLQSGSADALGLHQCAHHDALPASEPADHGHHHGDEPAPAENGHGACTCVGTCSISSVALAAAPAPVAVDVATTSFVVRTSAADLILPPQTPFLLPYATAPPASL